MVGVAFPSVVRLASRQRKGEAMYTYQMKVKNGEGWVKTVYVNAETFHDAVKKMKSSHGSEWIVYESHITFAE